MQFPLAVFALAMATAIFPAMASSASKNDMRVFADTVSFGLRSVFLLMIPSAVGLMILRKPIISVLFERNEFDSYSTEITSSALLYYCVGLFAYAGVHVLSRAFYSLQDMKTPVKVASIAMVLNIGLNLTLMWPLKIGGLALATSISAMVNVFLLGFFLRRRIGSYGGKKILISFSRVLGISAFMGLILFGMTQVQPVTDSFLRELAWLCASILIGAGTFFGALVLFDVQEFKILKRALLNHGKTQ